MIEIITAALLFIVCLILIRFKFYKSIVVALALSTLLHKELFSIYIWDLLPIRIFMAAFLLSSFIDFIIFNKFTLKFLTYLKDPFILINLLLIISRSISMVNTLNLRSSLSLTAFFISISVFLITIYIKLSSSDYLDLLKKYVNVSLILGLITFVQLFFYFQYSFLFGAVLNVAGRSVDIPSFSPTASYFNDVLKIVVMTRVGSLFWDVNHFGGFIASTLVFAFAFLLNAKTKISRIYYFITFSILGLVLFLTNSRSAWILAFVAFVVITVSLIYRKVGKKGLLYSLVFVSLLGTFLVFQYQDRNSWFREKVKSYFHYRLDSFDSHFLLLTGTVNVFDKYQWIGGGNGSFFEHFISTPTADEFLRRDPAGLSTKVPAHTIWGESLAETGLIGTSIFILLTLLILATHTYAIIHSKGEEYILSISFLGVTIGWLIAGIFYSYNSEFFYLCLMLPFLYSLKKLNININTLVDYFNQKSIYGFSLLFLICFFLIFYNLGTNKLIPFDEAIYAKVAKNIYESGDLWTLRWFKESFWFEKPPFYFIITSYFFDLFGVTEFAARLLPAICSLVLIIYTYRLSKLIFSNSRAAYLSIIALVTNVSYLYYSRTAMLDVIFTLFIVSSCYYFLKFQDSKSKIDLALTGVLVGLAVMTKNVIGFLPLGFFGIFYLIRIFKDRSIFLEAAKNMLSILFFAAVVSVPWHLHMYLKYGQEFFDSYFGYHLFRRFGAVIEQKGGPWNYYLMVIQNSMRIWLAPLLASLIYIVYKLFKNKSNEKTLFLIYSSILTLILFSVSSSKLRWYIIPVYPFLSILAGFFVADFLNLVDKYLKKPIFTFLISYFILVGSLYYLYTIRTMVYTSDLTGRMVELVILNNTQTYNKAQFFYVDKVDLPLVQYYSEKKYETVLYTSLRVNLLNSRDNKTNTTFITSQSRFLDIQRIIPEVTKISENKDYVLGSLKLD